MRDRRTPRWLRPLVVVALLVSAPALLLYWRMWNPWLDDGPFRGRARSDCAQLGRTPDQLYPLGGDRQLESYDASATGESATVLLRTSRGEVQWCVYADGHQQGDTARVRFLAHRGGVIRDITVRGSVRWAFGDEATWWKLGRDGALQAYWYSW
ncbi:hypothetical protein FGE12_22625 [Aggregicoccus sp. 17bor-14]|uniref:hypothetical protein n=1 Tax=Myxococcaceae TaxID=31 RepID=UPI00129CFCF5|nr:MULTISPECIES: hypothetical protein [Myxococcaceae]MBF5045217.1 hypothetical protein [Simulacricoccus sp. 17bor-14]MRI90958.1 hypothetical protein [Aggregicoccus sp. 17bor-14]